MTPLAKYNPAPFTAADALDSSATRRANALAAGLPANFLIANPDMLVGNVRLVGMTEDEFVKMFQVRIDGDQRVWMLPNDVIENTVKAHNTSAASPTGYGALGAPTGRYLAPANSNPPCIESIDSGYGQCGVRTLVVTGPPVIRFDMSLAKQFPVVGRTNFEFRAEVFNRVNFTPITGIGGTKVTDFEVTSAIGTAYQSRTMQLVFRFNW